MVRSVKQMKNYSLVKYLYMIAGPINFPDKVVKGQINCPIVLGQQTMDGFTSLLSSRSATVRSLAEFMPCKYLMELDRWDRSSYLSAKT